MKRADPQFGETTGRKLSKSTWYLAIIGASCQMRIDELVIDNDFKGCLPELSKDEYTQLEQSVVRNGLISPVITWNRTVIDGHNRVAICKAHRIKEVPVKEMSFGGKDEALEWILRNQLGRRNLTEYQRNVIALKYEEVIAARMREKQSQAGKEYGKGMNSLRSKEHKLKRNPTTRQELAKIAGTNESSIQRTKIILDKGTEEQKERAMRGGTGNSIGAIVKEIKRESEPMGICGTCKRVYPKKQLMRTGGTWECRECRRIRDRKVKEIGNSEEMQSIAKTVERIKSGQTTGVTRTDVLNELIYAADGLVDTWRAIITEHMEMIKADESIVGEAVEYLNKRFTEETI